MRIGDLDRRISVEVNTPSTDTHGDPIASWAEITSGAMWAGIDLSRGTSTFRESREVAENATVFRVRFLSTITVRMRVVYNSVNYDIVGIEEIGREEGLLLKTIAEVS